MNNEIKENCSNCEYNRQCFIKKQLGAVECQKDKDYITNLRTIEQQYSALLSENAELQNKYNKALETLVEYSMPCERDNFNLLDTDYCELNCSNDDEQFKKCWDKFIEWKIKDEQRNCSNK